MPPQIRLHGLAASGHAHNVEVFLRLLDLPFATAPFEALPGVKPMPRAA